jgi:hypothetical protein
VTWAPGPKFDKVIQDVIKANAERSAMKEFTGPLAELAPRSGHDGDRPEALRNPDEVGAAADRTCASSATWCSVLWCYSAGVAMKMMASDPAKAADPFYKAKLATARFYFAKLHPETATLLRRSARDPNHLALEAELSDHSGARARSVRV